MKKLISAIVILLFIGLAFAPSINANVGKEELVEFTTEVCGLNGGKQTVKLTQQQADEVEALFNSIRERLNATESREEAEEIFKDAVVELDKYGLLGGLSVKQAQRLVTGGFYNSKLINTIEKRIKNNHIYSENADFFCLIIGKTSSTVFIPLGRMLSDDILSVLFTISYILPNLARYFIGAFIMTLVLFQTFFPLRTFFPLAVGNGIGLGHSEYDFCYQDYTIHKPAEGFFASYCLAGIKEWDGSFYGQICMYALGFSLSHIGVQGFTGLKINNVENDEVSYIGLALSVGLGYNIPLFSE